MEMRRRERLRTEAMADERVTVKHVSDAAWVERRLSTVIAVSDEDTDEEMRTEEEEGGAEPRAGTTGSAVDGSVDAGDEGRAGVRSSSTRGCRLDDDDDDASRSKKSVIKSVRATSASLAKRENDADEPSKFL